MSVAVQLLARELAPCVSDASMTRNHHRLIFERCSRNSVHLIGVVCPMTKEPSIRNANS